MSTPAGWYEEQLERLELIADAGVNARDYLMSDQGHVWFLMQFDGLRALQAYCVAAGGTMVVLSDHQ